MSSSTYSPTNRLASKRLAPIALAVVAVLGAVGLAVGQRADAAGPNSPNIVFFLTDDMTANELSGLPLTQSLLAGNGVSFNRAYVSYPLCCPSRATFLTGRYMHNHATRGNAQPFGGAKRFEDVGGETQALPVRLKAAGYQTAHVGKYLNGYGGAGFCGEGSVAHVPAGWDWWFAKMAATNGACSENNYYQYSMFEKEGPADATEESVDYGSSDAEYQTDVYRQHAVDVLDDQLPGATPLYMEVNFGAPHGPFEPAPRHKFVLSAGALPVLPGFDEANVDDKPGFIRFRARHRLTSSEKLNILNRRKRRLEMLLSVDEAIYAVYNKVAASGELGNTYFIFTSDNGFFNGEHRIGNGKYLPYEPSGRVPFLIRGPGIAANAASDELIANIDLMPTVLQIAGSSAAPSHPVDGRSVLPFAADPTARSSRPLLLEGDTGPGIGPGQTAPEGLDRRGGKRKRKRLSKVEKLGLDDKRGVSDLDQEPGSERFAINGNIDSPAFKAIRTNRYLYVIYATGEQELYDMVKDPAQMRSQHENPRYKKVRTKMYRRLLPLAFCFATDCERSIGADPKPLKKKKKKKARGKKGR